MKSLIILILLALVGYAYSNGAYDDLQAKAQRIMYEYRADREVVLNVINVTKGGN